MVKVARIVNVVFNSNTYVIYKDDEKDVYLVDPGNTCEINKWIVNHNKCSIKGIFITHAHFDHICSINDFLKLNENIPIYLSSNNGKAIIEDEKKNYSKYHGTPYVVKAKHYVEVDDGSEYPLWDNDTIKILETLGHTEDSVSMICGNYLFTGDAFIPEIKVVTKTRGGNKQDALKSVQKIWRLISRFPMMTICPGHEEMKPARLLNKDFRYVEV